MCLFSGPSLQSPNCEFEKFLSVNFKTYDNNCNYVNNFYMFNEKPYT